MIPFPRRSLTVAVVAGCLAVILAVAVILAGAALAQFGPGWGRGGRGRRMSPMNGLPTDRAGVPDWKVGERFPEDVFTFVRVQYDSMYGGFGGRGRGGGDWATDWPDSDLNFSYRLQQLTSLKVNPEPISLRLTDPRLFDYPFLYMIEPGRLVFSEEEVAALRRYLLNGGFMMVDDFWGAEEYENFYREIKRVFPDREPFDIPLDHQVFQCVYKLRERPQVPSIHSWLSSGQMYEDHGPGSVEVHYRGINDDKGRLVVFIGHNTDLGDGWEREGEDPSYFKEFSEKKSYPMGINIVTYAMTH